MSPASAHAPPPADRAASTRALTERQMAKLERLAEIGMEIAEAAGRAARGEGDGAQGLDPGLTYSRAARAVRLTIALQQRLTEGLAAFEQARVRARGVEAVQLRSRIQRRIERVAEKEDGDADVAEALSSCAWERLTETEDDDLLDLPFEEAVARICRDLGLAPAAFIAREDPSVCSLPLGLPAGSAVAPERRATICIRSGDADGAAWALSGPPSGTPFATPSQRPCIKRRQSAPACSATCGLLDRGGALIRI